MRQEKSAKTVDLFMNEINSRLALLELDAQVAQRKMKYGKMLALGAAIRELVSLRDWAKEMTDGLDTL